MKKYFILILSAIIISVAINCFIISNKFTQKKYAIILQAGKESHEGMARAVHALIYSKELKENGYDVVLIFDGAGTEWAEEFKNPESTSVLIPHYKSVEELGITEVICEYCAGAFQVKEQLQARLCPLSGEYQGHPSIVKWIKKGYELVIL